MAIADNKALLSEIMNVVDDHVTAKVSRQLEQQIIDILDGYQIATMIRDDAGDADNSRQLIDAFINAKTAEGLAKSSLYLYRNRLTRLYEDTGVPIKKMNADHLKDYIASAADVVEWKTGRWLIYDSDANVYECSFCHELFILNEGTPRENNFNYFPFCGAKMEETNDH